MRARAPAGARRGSRPRCSRRSRAPAHASRARPRAQDRRRAASSTRSTRRDSRERRHARDETREAAAASSSATRLPARAGEHAATTSSKSAAKAGRAATTGTADCNGSISVVSRPNMCCGGTVPTITVPGGGEAIERISALRAVGERSPRLGVRLRASGRARGEEHRRAMIAGDARARRRIAHRVRATPDR